MIEDYLALGWGLVPIRPLSKVPKGKEWNKKENLIRSVDDLGPEDGVGLAHAYSGTMALDIDNFKAAAGYLSGFGINLKALCLAPQAVCIESGVPQRGKLLYRVPEILPTKSIRVNGVTVLEFLCATRTGMTSQNLLPPSIHPTTRIPYKWTGYGHYKDLPNIPEPLFDLWKKLTELKPTSGNIEADPATIQNALGFIPADLDRDSWIRVGMALHHASRDDELFDLWNEWSAQSEEKYPGSRAMLYQWGSFAHERDEVVTLGTLFEIARQYGWEQPRPDVSHLFMSAVAEAEDVKPDNTPIDIYDLFDKPLPDPLIELWPEALRNQAIHVGDSVGCDPLVSLYAGMAAVCAVVDARISLELVPGFKVPPILWLMTIGDPADKKTPASRPMFSPLAGLEMEDRSRYEGALALYELNEIRYATAKKEMISKVNDPYYSDDEVVAEIPVLMQKPTELRLYVKDITSQKLVRTASENPRGFICYLDEMASWVRKVSDKTSGEDRSAWVVAYEGDSYTMDRVGAGTIRCANFSVGMYGNIQPNVLRANADLLTADGLLQRFMPACLRPGMTRLGHPTVSDHKNAYEGMLRKLFTLPENEYTLSPAAYELFRAFQAKYEQRKADERLIGSDNVFMTAFGKLEGLCGRLILLFHLMEDPYSLQVSASVTHRVIRIINEFVIPSMRHAFVDMLGVKSFDRWLADHVSGSCEAEVIKLPDIRRAIVSQLKIQNTTFVSDALLVAAKILERNKWIFRMDDGKKEHMGYAEWAVNPYLKDMTEARRKRISDASDRVKNNRY